MPLVIRRHWLFSVLFITGAVLRAVALAAYQPIFLLQRDAYVYLSYAYRDDLALSTFRPVAYPILFLKPLLATGSLTFVAVAQHALGLAIAATFYFTLLRLGVPPLLAAIGPAPILLDGYQISLEHFVLTEAFFETLITAALVLLVWSRRPPVIAFVMCGALIALASVTRFAGVALVVPVAIFILTRKMGWLRFVALVVAFGIPIAAYSLWFKRSYGSVGVTNRNGFFLYGRVASFADCSLVSLPEDLRQFCFRKPPEQRGANRGVFTFENLQRITVVPDANAKLLQFSRIMILVQPYDYARVVAADLWRYFEPTPPVRQEPYVKRWRFPVTLSDADPLPYVLKRKASAPPRMGFQRFTIDRGRARFLRSYQDVVYTRGPILAALLLIGLAGSVVGIFRRRDDGLPSAAALFSLSGVALLLLPVATTVYHFRYVVPVVPLAGVAGALGAAAIWRRLDRREQPDGG